MNKNREALQQLLKDQDLTVSVYKQIPQRANAFRMNDIFPIFYLLDTFDNMRKFPPLRYLRYCGRFVPLNINKTMTLEQFNDFFSVIPVFDFVQAAVKEYPLQIIADSNIERILSHRPMGAEYYNYMGKKYCRPGASGYAEFWLEGDQWCDSGEFMPNDELSRLINLESLLKRYQAHILIR